MFPRIADRTLVDLATYRESFPKIPDVAAPQVVYTPVRLDLGPRWAGEGIIDHVPPKVGPAYRTLVPAIDADGNEIAGLRLPEVAVPIAATTGWTLRHPAVGGETQLLVFAGGTVPFAATQAQRELVGDPRLSIEERYASKDVYLERVRAAGEALVAERYLIEEDIEVSVAQASKFWDWFAD